MLLLLEATDSFETVAVCRQRWELDAIRFEDVGKSWVRDVHAHMFRDQTNNMCSTRCDCMSNRIATKCCKRTFIT